MISKALLTIRVPGLILIQSNWTGLLHQWQRLLWIKGKPGSGKSTLMKHAVNLAEHNRSRFICFYVHGRGTELQKTPFGLFRSLLHQLLQLTPNLLSSFASLYQGKLETRGNFEEFWTWQLTELKDLFKSYVLDAVKSQPLQIYVDALDEAGEDAARSLIACFQQISTQSPNSKLAIYFSCRHYPILTSRDNPSISMEEEN